MPSTSFEDFAGAGGGGGLASGVGGGASAVRRRLARAGVRAGAGGCDDVGGGAGESACAGVGASGCVGVSACAGERVASRGDGSVGAAEAGATAFVGGVAIAEGSSRIVTASAPPLAPRANAATVSATTRRGANVRGGTSSAITLDGAGTV